jgi:hypothetical protein
LFWLKAILCIPPLEAQRLGQLPSLLDTGPSAVWISGADPGYFLCT